MDDFFANGAIINLFLIKIGLVGFDEGACCGFDLFDAGTGFAVINGETFEACKKTPEKLMVLVVKMMLV